MNGMSPTTNVSGAPRRTASAVDDALVHGHRHRAGVAVDAHAQRVADEDHVDAGRLLELAVG